LDGVDLDHRAFAGEIGLRYTESETEPSIRRRRHGRGFTYVGPSGRVLAKSNPRRREVESLAIPPAWRDVWISPWADGHLQATGYDEAGRKQYRYHDEWQAARKHARDGLLVRFGYCLPSLRQHIDELLAIRQPTYDVVQVIHDDLPAAAMRDNLDEVLAAGDSVSIFTTWDPRGAEQVWVKQRTDGDRRPMPDGWLGSRTAKAARHPVRGMPAEATTEQVGVRGPWHTRLPHFRLDHTPSAGEELQTEYLVDRSDAAAVLEAVGALHERVRPPLLVSELRSIAADDLWLSPSYGRESLAVHFTWRPEPEAVLPVVEALEGVLAPFGARPHWGKVFGTDPGALAATYPRHDLARRLRRELDPDDVFGNEFLDTYLPR